MSRTLRKITVLWIKNILSQWMTAKDYSSELEVKVCDKTNEALILNQELDELRATNQAIATRMKELESENGDLEEEACDLFDKVYTAYLNIMYCLQHSC